MADPREILRAAQLAVQEGRTDDATFLMDQYEAARTQAPPPLPRAEFTPQPWERPGLTAEKQAAEVEQRTAAALEPRLEVQPGEAARTREQIQRDLARERGTVLTAGGGTQAPADAGVLPPFRPTRIQQAPDGTLLYRDPTTGTTAPATTAQLFVEAFAQQHVLTEEQAREMAAVAEQMPADTLRQRFSRYLASPTGALQTSSGAGVVETPLGATLRGVLGLGSAVVGETVFGENAVSFPVQKALASALLPEGTASVPSRQDPTLERPYDPEGRRVASTEPTAVRRVAENLAAGRTLLDEFSDQPGIRAAVGPEAAYWLGLPAELLTPANVGLVTGPLKAAGLGGKAVAAAERAVAPSARAVALETVGRRLEGPALKAAEDAIRAADNTGAAVEDAVRAVDEGAATEVAAAIRSAEAPSGGLSSVSEDLLVPAQEAARLRPQIDAAVTERLTEPLREVAPPRLAAFLDPAHPLRASIPPELAHLAGDYKTWADLPAPLATALRNHLRTTEALRLAEEAAVPVRWAAETSIAKVLDPTATGEFWWSRLPPGALRSIAQRVASKGVLPTAATVKGLREMQAAGSTASRALRRDLLRAARETGSGLKAVEKTFLAKAAADHEEAWARLFRGMFGRQSAPYLEAAQTALRTEDGGMIAPSIANVRDVVRFLQSTGRVSSSPLVRYRLSERSLQRRMLATLLNYYYRAEAGARAADYDRLSRLVVGEGGSLGALRRAEDTLPLDGQRLGYALDPAASAAEARIAGDLERLPQLVERIEAPAALNDSLMALGASAAEWSAQGGKAVLQRLHHGWIVPNIPIYLGRLTTAPLVPLLTLGLGEGSQVIGGIGAAAARRVGRWMPREAGIRTPDGLVYTPAQVESMAESFSLGVSRLESERVGQLGQDLARAAQDAATRSGDAVVGTSWTNPAARSYWMAQAEALEVWARRTVFEDGLRGGMSPAESAARARRAFFDYGAAPEVVRETLGRWLYTASHQHMLLSTLAERAAGSAPQAIVGAAKGVREQQKAADPYGLDGDNLLRHLGVKTVGSQRFYGPEVGLFGPVEQVLRAARWGNVLAVELGRAAADADLEAFQTTAAQGAGSALLGAGELLLGGTAESVRAMQAYSEAPETARSPQRQDEAAFWAAAIVAAQTDSWPMFERVFQPVKVKPPPESAHYLASVPNSGMEYAWGRQPPEGVPHVAIGVDGTGEPIYYVIKPSAVGLSNLKLIRAATPDRIEQLAAGAAGAWIDEPSQGVQAGGRTLYPEWALPKGWETAAGVLATPAGASDTEQERLRQVEQLRQIREGR